MAVPDTPINSPDAIQFFVSDQPNGNAFSSVTHIDLLNAFQTAIGVWGDRLITGVDIDAHFQGFTSQQAAATPGQNVIGFENPFSHGSQTTTIAVTTPTILGGDILLNSSGFEFELFPSDFAAGVDPLPPACDTVKCADLQSIVTHEVGHLLGLTEHSSDPNATMFAFYDPLTTGIEQRTLAQDDIDRIRDLYGFTPPPEFTTARRSEVVYQLDFDQDFAMFTGNNPLGDTSHVDFDGNASGSGNPYVGTDSFAVAFFANGDPLDLSTILKLSLDDLFWADGMARQIKNGVISVGALDRTDDGKGGATFNPMGALIQLTGAMDDQMLMSQLFTIGDFGLGTDVDVFGLQFSVHTELVPEPATLTLLGLGLLGLGAARRRKKLAA